MSRHKNLKNIVQESEYDDAYYDEDYDDEYYNQGGGNEDDEYY